MGVEWERGCCCRKWLLLLLDDGTKAVCVCTCAFRIGGGRVDRMFLQ
jgi:hypothetical protein